jgi:lipoprotein-releasing system permease protein
MATKTAPFSGFEFMIAWRYLRARRAEGGVSTMTWISLIGITLAVFALILTLAVRAGFRAEFVDTILGANAHVTVYSSGVVGPDGQMIQGFTAPDAMAEAIRKVPGVTRAAPLIKGKVMVSDGEDTTGAEVYGLLPEDFASIPRIGTNAENAIGDIARFADATAKPQPIAVGSGIARELGITVGDRVRLISPEGVKSPLGFSPRINAYEVVYIFSAGRYDIDSTRIYMPFVEAQSYFNKEGTADEIEVMVEKPDEIESYGNAILTAAGPAAMLWTWKDSSGAFLRALDIEDNVMFVILSVLVLIATMNIVSGLIMLVKNKGRDIGILRTMGLSEGSVLRVFFICGAFTGVIGTIAGVALGCVTALNIDQIMSFLNWLNGADVWDPSIRGIYALPAKLQLDDIMSAAALSLGLSFIVTFFPARRAARMNPVEALRYE